MGGIRTLFGEAEIAARVIENSVAPTIRLAEADEKPVRGRAADRAKAVSRVQAEPAVKQDSVEQSAPKIVPETLIARESLNHPSVKWES
jgi:hypothetical protein